MASKEQLRKIAMYCDFYTPRNDNPSKMISSSHDREFESCENCSHFTPNGQCDINLIDKILSSLAMEEDLKS